jgi:hypothetical protein
MADGAGAMVRLKAPRAHTSVGFAGSEYAVVDGIVTVPDEAEAALKAHGYRRPPAGESPAGRPPAQ